ncbi:MAG: acyltransferase family protein [Actinomycetota bacterium]|nr:acyltransferase family protein [Actinomycetota bacterium]
MVLTAGRPEAAPARPAKLRKLPGLDGLRAIAVVAVIVFHLDPSWLPGGFLGVDVFFVISGYLITALVISELDRTSTLSLRRFWTRRARRLLPALGFLLVSVTLVAALVGRDALGPMRGDLPASVFYVLNWRLLFTHDSYAASFGRPPLLQHLWSLSVEEQFYLLWPPALLLLRRSRIRSRIAAVALGGAAASAALMALLYRAGDPSGVYFGTDTHAEGLLIGCALAAAVPPWRMTAAVAPTARKVLEYSGVVALAVVVAGLIVLGFDSAATYRGGMVVVDVATAVVVATVAHPASRLGALLGRQPLRWLGLRSYSLYLWHWPIFELTRPGADLAWPTLPDVVLRVALTGAAAELTYRYIEQPWRDGRAQFALRVRAASLPRPQVVAAAALPVALVVLLLATAPGAAEPAILSEGATAAAHTPLPPPPSTGPGTAVAPRPSTAPDDPSQDTVFDPHPFRPVTTTAAPPTTTTVAPPPPAPTPPGAGLPPLGPLPAADQPVLAIGDSVLLAASPTMNATFGPAVTVDAAVGRQVSAGITRLTAYRQTGALAHYKTVVIDLGTNGLFTPTQFAQMTALLAGVPRVVVFDVHAARSWAAASNDTITAGVAAHPAQMKLADWNATVTPPMLYSDGIHPNPTGSAVYTRLIEKAVLAAPA